MELSQNLIPHIELTEECKYKLQNIQNNNNIYIGQIVNYNNPSNLSFMIFDKNGKNIDIDNKCGNNSFYLYLPIMKLNKNESFINNLISLKENQFEITPKVKNNYIDFYNTEIDYYYDNCILLLINKKYINIEERRFAYLNDINLCPEKISTYVNYSKETKMVSCLCNQRNNFIKNNKNFTNSKIYNNKNINIGINLFSCINLFKYITFNFKSYTHYIVLFESITSFTLLIVIFKISIPKINLRLNLFKSHPPHKKIQKKNIQLNKNKFGYFTKDKFYKSDKEISINNNQNNVDSNKNLTDYSNDNNFVSVYSRNINRINSTSSQISLDNNHLSIKKLINNNNNKNDRIINQYLFNLNFLLYEHSIVDLNVFFCGIFNQIYKEKFYIISIFTNFNLFYPPLLKFIIHSFIFICLIFSNAFNYRYLEQKSNFYTKYLSLKNIISFLIIYFIYKFIEFIIYSYIHYLYINNNKTNKNQKMIYNFKIKIIFIFIIILICNVIMWYYLYIFGFIHNTIQINIILNSFINILMIYILQIIFSILCCIFRKNSIRKRNKCLFNISKFFYMIT